LNHLEKDQARGLSVNRKAPFLANRVRNWERFHTPRELEILVNTLEVTVTKDLLRSGEKERPD
jgi:hypothetical protein